jgi:hypothetical protein
MALNLDRFNTRVKDWTSTALAEMKSAGGSMGIEHRPNSDSPGSSLSKLKAKEHLTDGAIDRIGFKLNRSLVWTHYGAGKGRGGVVGSSWTTKDGQRKNTNPDSLGKMGSGSRKAKPWFNSVLQGGSGIEELADIAAEELAAEVTNKILI